MKRITAKPILQAGDWQRLLDYLRELFTSANQAADGRLFEFVSITTTYTAGENDHVILAAPAAPFTITLPAASAMRNKKVTIKRTNTSVHTITVTPASGNVDGSASTTLTTSLQSRTLYSDGSNYWLI